MSPPLRPCRGCPWAPRTPGFLHPERADEVADCARDGIADFYCHSTTVTVEHDDGSEDRDVGPLSELCAGYLIAAFRDGVPGPMARVEARLGTLDASHYETVDPEHDLALDPDEMANHHRRPR